MRERDEQEILEQGYKSFDTWSWTSKVTTLHKKMYDCIRDNYKTYMTYDGGETFQQIYTVPDIEWTCLQFRVPYDTQYHLQKSFFPELATRTSLVKEKIRETLKEMDAFTEASMSIVRRLNELPVNEKEFRETVLEKLAEVFSREYLEALPIKYEQKEEKNG